MKNLKTQYDLLHGKDAENVIYLSENYPEVLSDENKNIAADVLLKQGAFTKEVNGIFNKDFLLVFSERNSNKRLVRKYYSTQTMRTREEKSKVVLFPSNEDQLIFVKMDKKAYDKMTLDDKQLRYLPGSPSSILEQIAASMELADNAKLTFVLGPDAEFVRKALDSDKTSFVYENFKPVRAGTAAPGEKTVRVPALQLPLFTTRNDGNKTYQQCVDEGRILVIDRGNEHILRDLSNTTRWRKESISNKFAELYNWTGDEVFNKKLCYIKMGDYKRIQKYVPNKTDLPTWDEVIVSTFTKNKDYVVKMFALAGKRSVKDATSIFSSYTKSCWEAAVKVAEKVYNNQLSAKQQEFINDLKTCADIREASCDYSAGNCAEDINRWLCLNVPDTRNSANQVIDLNLKTKYPWTEILNTYHCDEYEPMVHIMKIVDTYQ